MSTRNFMVFYTDGHYEFVHAESKSAAKLKSTTPRMGYNPSIQYVETEEEYLAKLEGGNR